MNGILGRVVARLRAGAGAHNVLNLPPAVPIHIQRSPDFPQGDTRGVVGLDFQVVTNGAVTQVGRTGPDGRIDVRVPPGGTSILQLLRNGAAVAEYVISLDASALSAVNTVLGQQQRLRMLGYQLGHGGADGNGVDGTQRMEFERSLLDFQADQGILPDGTANANTRTQLTTRAGG